MTKSDLAPMLIVLCGAVLSCILVAGLWPFHAPRNQVSWLGVGNGLFFGKYGSIVSAAPFKSNQRRPDDSCSLEIWLEPKRVHSSGTILAFYESRTQVTSFAMRQSLGDLVLLLARQNDLTHAKKVKFYVDDVLSHQKPVLITISSGQLATMVFADGLLVRRIDRFKLSIRDLAGRLIIGNSPVTTDDWSGHVKGLAVYDRELSADDISKHFLNWTNAAQPNLAKNEGAVALYFFNEASGNKVHNEVDSTTDLVIPERFFVLHAQFLERPWDEFRPDWNYWKDVGINIAGFVPLGIFFYPYFSYLQRTEHPAAITIAFGFVVSLIIEVSQAFLPTRDSGMTDLVTNTLGTALGAMVFRHQAVQTVVAAIGLHDEDANSVHSRVTISQ